MCMVHTLFPASSLDSKTALSSPCTFLRLLSDSSSFICNSSNSRDKDKALVSACLVLFSAASLSAASCSALLRSSASAYIYKGRSIPRYSIYQMKVNTNSIKLPLLLFQIAKGSPLGVKIHCQVIQLQNRNINF